ncbi:MAG TPA: hypothetical protein VH092_37680, partial [Urbifossiella sp.]|nr:hypothetical protein [Urbifossiella sp.]
KSIDVRVNPRFRTTSPVGITNEAINARVPGRMYSCSRFSGCPGRAITRRSGAALRRKAPDSWRWRRVTVADGTTRTVADTRQAERDLRSRKCSMGRDRLRGKAPPMVRRGRWAYLLAYDLTPGVMASSASEAGVTPRQRSFAGAVPTLRAFAPVLASRAAEARADGLSRLWEAVGSHRAGGRPDRVEPRAVKRRKKGCQQLREPRKAAQRQFLRAA